MCIKYIYIHEIRKFIHFFSSRSMLSRHWAVLLACHGSMKLWPITTIIILIMIRIMKIKTNGNNVDGQRIFYEFRWMLLRIYIYIWADCRCTCPVERARTTSNNEKKNNWFCPHIGRADTPKPVGKWHTEPRTTSSALRKPIGPCGSCGQYNIPYQIDIERVRLILFTWFRCWCCCCCCCALTLHMAIYIEYML